MLKEELMEKYYSNGLVRKVPVLFACECFKALEQILEEEREENPYGSISELFDKQSNVSTTV